MSIIENERVEVQRLYFRIEALRLQIVEDAVRHGVAVIVQDVVAPVVVGGATAAGLVVLRDDGVVVEQFVGHGFLVLPVCAGVNHQVEALLGLQVGMLAGYAQTEAADYEDTFGELEHFGYLGRIDGAQIADAVGSQAAGFGGHHGAHHGQRGVDDAHGDAVHGVGEVWHVEPLLLGQQRDFVIVDAEDKEAVAGLDLLLVGDGVELFLHLLIGDVDDRELLAVVACWGVADCLKDEVHRFGRYGFALVAAYCDAVEQSLAYVSHCIGGLIRLN